MDEYIPEGYIPNDRYYIFVEMYTYLSFIEQPELIIHSIESTFMLADQFALDLHLDANPHRKQKVVRPFTPEAWEWCKKQFRAGRIEIVATYRTDYLPPALPIPRWEVEIYPHELLRRAPQLNDIGYLQFPVPNTFRLIVELPQAMDRVEKDFQEKVSSVARSIFGQVNAVYGLIDLTRLPPGGSTPFELQHQVQDTWIVGLLSRLVRGAFWENFLSKGHVQELGGVDQIKSMAPCARVDLVSHGVVLRLTDSINNVTPDLKRSLEEYFSPLAPRIDLLRP
jgi:hypothetical protein